MISLPVINYMCHKQSCPTICLLSEVSDPDINSTACLFNVQLIRQMHITKVVQQIVQTIFEHLYLRWSSGTTPFVMT